MTKKEMKSYSLAEMKDKYTGKIGTKRPPNKPTKIKVAIFTLLPKIGNFEK